MARDDVLVAQLRLLHDELRHLEALQPALQSFAAFSEDWVLKRAVERALELCAAACFAMGRHIIAIEGYRYPQSNADVFVVLQENGLLNKRAVETLIKMAGFRNMILHEYTKVDPAATYGVFRNHLNDFRQFAEAVNAYMAED